MYNAFTPEQAITFLNALNYTYTTTYKGHTRIDDTGKSYTVGDYTESRPISTQIKVLMNIAIYGGLRRGEILGLTWDDVNFDKNTVDINKSVGIVNNKTIIKAPKNKSSNREISLPSSVMQLLNFWKPNSRI